MIREQGLELEDLLALQRSWQARERGARFWAEGLRFHDAATSAGTRPLAMLVARELAGLVGEIVARRARRAGIVVRDVTEHDFRRLSVVSEPSGLGLVMPMVWRRLLETTRRAHPRHATHRELWLGFDDIRAPGNLGTMLRTAAAAGATGAVFLGGSADPYDASCVRATMGALFTLRLCRATVDDVARWARRRSATVLGADGGGSLDYRDASYRGPTLVMIGCERGGLTDRQRALCADTVSIPMAPSIDSLNVAAATAILLYEAVAQRDRRRTPESSSDRRA